MVAELITEFLHNQFPELSNEQKAILLDDFLPIRLVEDTDILSQVRSQIEQMPKQKSTIRVTGATLERLDCALFFEMHTLSKVQGQQVPIFCTLIDLEKFRFASLPLTSAFFAYYLNVEPMHISIIFAHAINQRLEKHHIPFSITCKKNDEDNFEVTLSNN